MNVQSIQPALQERLAPAFRRVRAQRIFAAVTLVLFLSALVGLGLFWMTKTGSLPNSNITWIALLAAALATAAIAGILAATSVNMDNIALRLESKFPELNSSLMTAIEQDASAGQQLSFLQQDVIRTAVYHSYQNSWSNIVPGWKLFGTPALALAGLMTLLISVAAIALFATPALGPNVIDFDSVTIKQPADYEIVVEPGNAEVEKETNVLVMARFGSTSPETAELVFQSKDGNEQRIEMTKSLDDPVFGARIPSIKDDVQYRIDFGGRNSETYEVKVFEYPALIRNDVEVVFPAYTSMEPKQLKDVRRVSAVEGSTAKLQLSFNKPLASATMKTDTGEEIELEVDASDPLIYRATLPMTEVGSRKFKLSLVDDNERENKSTSQFVFNVLKNREPDLKLLRPSRDLQISAVEELDLKANVWDDFGVNSVGVSYMLGDEVKERVLSESVAAKKRTALETILAMEELDAQVDQLVSYFFWAEDYGPDGNLRRVSSDMFFAEIRPFDEIYREGQAPPGGQQSQQGQQPGGGQGEQATQKLAELQKEIINATWKIIRRETNATPSETFKADTELLIESQQGAITLLDEKAAEQETADDDLADVKHFMNSAINDFNTSLENGPESLKPALKNAQLAYQALLKLRAKEHQVAKMNQQQQQQSSSQQNSNSRQQQQLNQMELASEDNRYEQERKEAPAEETAEERDNRQILNRLKELARRQGDLNDRINELQSVLNEAETEEERQEIERELKRLREEQKNIVDDLEEMQQRMQQSENQQQMSEQADQVEKARENAQQSADALEKNELSQAAAEGTRAENQLNELKEEFQNRISGQFDEQMREMRNEAQQLELDEQELAEELQGMEEQQQETTQLRDTDDRGDLERQLEQQVERIEKLREEMKSTIEAAEENEPLLAEELYETYRDSELQRPDEALDSARRSLSNGFTNDAINEENRAREGIEKLREGIEKAAESILGDDEKALEAARNRLEQLSRELNQEIKRNDPAGESSPENQAEGNPGSNPNGQPGEAENSEREQQAGSPQDQERQRQNQEPQQSQPGEQPGEQPGQQPGEQPGQQPGQQPGENGQPGQGQAEAQNPGDNPRDASGDASENQGDPQNPGSQPSGDNRGGDQANRDRQQLRDSTSQPNVGESNRNRSGDPNLNDRNAAPLTGEDFLDWTDRLRDVESMVPVPELRAEASRLREKAKEIRKDLKRHSKDPNWPLVRLQLAAPLAELQKRVSDELIRRSSKNATVPLDRESIPVEYKTMVEKYFEQLGNQR